MAANRFEKNARTFTLLTLVSRVTGLARDATLARAFGVGPVMDAFSFGFMVPNLFRRLFGEGALSAAFLPIYARLVRDEPESAKRFASLTLVLLAITLNAVVILGEIVLFAMHSSTPAQEFVLATPVSAGGMLIAPMSVRLPQLGLELLMVMLPYMPLVCMVAVLGSVLQTHDRFGPTAASPVLLNLSIVAACIGLFPIFRGTGLAGQGTHAVLVGGSVVIAGVLQLVWALIAARDCGLSLRGLSLRPNLGPAWTAVRDMLAKSVPMMLGLGVLQVNTFIDGLVASWPTVMGPTIFGAPFPLAEGAMAALGNAQRLYEFPLGVFGIAVAAAIFPVLAKQAKEPEAYLATLRRGIRLVLFIGLPASVGLMLVARPAVAVVLEGGRFTADDTARVAFILLGYAPAVWSYSLVNVLTRAFYAVGDSKTPTTLSLAMVGLNFALNITLIFTPLREAGLAWSTAICSVLQSIIMVRILTRRFGPIVDRDVRRSCTAIVIATALMALAIVATRMLFPAAHAGWWGAVRELSAEMLVGALVLLGAAVWMRRPELRWALGRS